MKKMLLGLIITTNFLIFSMEKNELPKSVRYREQSKNVLALLCKNKNISYVELINTFSDYYFTADLNGDVELKSVVLDYILELNPVMKPETEKFVLIAFKKFLELWIDIEYKNETSNVLVNKMKKIMLLWSKAVAEMVAIKSANLKSKLEIQ